MHACMHASSVHGKYECIGPHHAGHGVPGYIASYSYIYAGHVAYISATKLYSLAASYIYIQLHIVMFA